MSCGSLGKEHGLGTGWNHIYKYIAKCIAKRGLIQLYFIEGR